MNELLEALDRLYYTTAQKENGLTRKEAYKKLVDFIVDHKGVTINGKTIEEVITILNGLELERIYGIKMTMENMSLWKEIYKNELIKSVNSNLEKIIKDYKCIGEKND